MVGGSLADPRPQGAFSAAHQGGPERSGAIPRLAVGHLKAVLSGFTSIVEVGASTGILTGALHRARCPVIAVEDDPIALGQLARSLPGVSILCADAAALPLRDASVDAVIVTTDGISRRTALGEGDRIRAAEIRRIVGRHGVVVNVAVGAISDVSSAGPEPRDVSSTGGVQPVGLRRFTADVGEVPVEVWAGPPELWYRPSTAG